MSGIDLWDDDLGADSATVEVPPLYIHLIAASEHEAFWRLGLEDHGVRLGDADSAECQLILVDERCPDYEQRLAQLPQRDGSARPHRRAAAPGARLCRCCASSAHTIS